mmetsp:Transcript_115726/g.230696  ORF Transcript_115726/g.230696 Transcript_115726/m.230696 type:complete len:219 (+) Transcript_115726:661-1317(+)
MKGEVGVLETAAGIGDGHAAGCACCCGGDSGVQSAGAHESRLQLPPGGVDGAFADGRQPCGIVFGSLMPLAREIGVRPMTSGGTGGSRPAGMADCRKPHSGLEGGVASSGVVGMGIACSPTSGSSTLVDDDGGVAVAAASLISASSKLTTGGAAVDVAFTGVSSRRNGGGGDLGSVLTRLKARPSGTKWMNVFLTGGPGISSVRREVAIVNAQRGDWR